MERKLMTPMYVRSIEDLSSEIKGDPKLRTTVPNRLSSPLPEIAKAKRILEEAEVYEGLKWPRGKCLSIEVAPENINRALRIMNTLLKVLLERGHSVRPTSESTIYVHKYKIPIRMFESRKKVKTDDWRGYGYKPKGKIKIQYGPSYWRKEIVEGKIPLEDQIVRVVATLEHYALDELESRRINEIHLAKIEAEREKEKKLAERKKEEIYKVKALLNEVELWDKAKRIRDYLSHTSRQNHKNDEWRAWALAISDWLDPTQENDDEFLSEEEKSSLLRF